MVYSGYSIKEEMCVNYIYYYPKTNLELCKSSIDTKALDAYFRFGPLFDVKMLTVRKRNHHGTIKI